LVKRASLDPNAIGFAVNRIPSIDQLNNMVWADCTHRIRRDKKTIGKKRAAGKVEPDC
jgi:hypothetical protein